MSQVARVLLGLLVIFVVSMVGDVLLPETGMPKPMYWSPVATLIGLVGAFLGGLVARRGLLLPALAVWLCLWCYLTWALYQIADGTGNASLSSILHFNGAAIAASFAALIVGILAGQWLARRLTARPVATA